MSIFNLFSVGTPTTSTALGWAIIFTVEHPEVSTKVQAAVDTWTTWEKKVTEYRLVRNTIADKV